MSTLFIDGHRRDASDGGVREIRSSAETVAWYRHGEDMALQVTSPRREQQGSERCGAWCAHAVFSS